MRAIIQRVLSASVTIDGKIYSKINRGYMILLGISEDDSEDDAKLLAKKIAMLRIMEDENGKMNLSLSDVGGEILVVSNFTLYGEIERKGNRPSFIKAGKPPHSENLYELFLSELKNYNIIKIETGIFGADMIVDIKNDGPVTLIADTAVMNSK